MEFEHSINVAAPPEAVWARLIDLDRASEVVPVLDSIELLDGGVHQGARVRVTVSGMGSRRHAEGRITAAQPGRRLALEADVPEVKATVAIEWDISPAPAGSTVTQRLAIRFRSTLARIAARALVPDAKVEAAAQQGLAALKQAVESDAGAGSHPGGVPTAAE